MQRQHLISCRASTQISNLSLSWACGVIALLWLLVIQLMLVCQPGHGKGVYVNT